MRVAFLHPYKMADHFFVEALETAIIADLVTDGHEAEAVDYLFDAARSEAEQIGELRDGLVRGGYDLVFLERPWSDAMVAGLAPLRLVAYGRPELVERGLVELGVVHTGRATARSLVRALAANEPLASVPGILYREGEVVQRTDGPRSLSMREELSDARFAHDRRRVLSKAAANAKRAVVVANLGCAYRNVPNRSGVFDGVSMPEGVSTAGCTFCDASAYERMTEPDAIALLVAQVEAVLRDRPEVHEIAIKDDYAVRFLGKLGDALRPLGLGTRDVLLSARAEYLLDFRGEIEEALAGRFPTPLGFYLIGFENFSEPELRRFHKGMSAEQVERVLSLMQEWTTRYPGRFRIAPTSGFILFTPWTTLEDLRVNASAMRRLGFERYRGRALLSQLRLYPNLPLYWLAKHDGLLVTSFESDEASDAHRRGYEADHGWRFRDPKVAAVQRRLLEAQDEPDERLFEIFEDALDEAAGVARGKKSRPLRMVRAPGERGSTGPAARAIPLTHACNQRCSFCLQRGVETVAPRARAVRAIQSVRAAAKEGARRIVITGAEPTLEWYLLDLARLAHDLGIADVWIETNGTLVDEQGGGAALAAAGVGRAVVALTSLDPGVSDAITHDPGGHARTMRGIRALLDGGVAVELAVPLVPENRGALADVVSRAGALFPAGRAELEGVVARVIPRGARHPRPIGITDAAAELVRALEASRVSGVALRIAPGGELPPCVFPDADAARDVVRVGAAIVEREASRYRRIPACASCAARSVCAGPLVELADDVAPLARAIADASRAALVPVSGERERVLSEYRSQLFLGGHEGRVVERRIVRLLFHCNQACDFCFVSRELPAVEHELIVEEIRQAAARGAVLDLSGGEPTLSPRLAEYIALAVEAGVPELDLQTNAIRMADAAYAKTLAEAGLRQAFVSLHGHTAAVSDRVTASPGTFVKTLKGLENLRALGIATRLNFVLCGYNVDELATFPDFVAERLRAPAPDVGLAINFSFVAASTDNVPRDTGLIPRFSQVAWALRAAYERASTLGIPMSGFDSKCGIPACYMPPAIREEYFGADIPAEELARATGFVKSEACARCDLDRRCYGVRASYAELYGVDELRPVRAAATPDAAPSASSRSDVWRKIGLAFTHTRRADSDARLGDDASFAPVDAPWIGSPDAPEDREVVQLAAGLREVMKVERASADAAERTAETYRARGLAARVYVGPPGIGGSAPRAIAFVGREARAVDEAIAIEPGLTASLADRAPLVRRMGQLLGYPTCCTAAFAAAREQDDATHIARLARGQTHALCPEQNWALTPLRLFSHFPCAPDCPATLALARATLERMSPRQRDYLMRALRSVVVMHAADRFAVLLHPRADGRDAFAYEGVLSHRNLGMDPDVPSREAFRAFWLEVIRPLEEGRRVARTHRTLVVTGRDGGSTTIQFAEHAPPLLDFTSERARRHLPLAAPR